MASEIRVNKITHTAGVGTITTNTDGIVVAGIVTANNFSGDVTGNVTGNLSGGTINATSGTVTGNLGVGGVLTYEDVTNIDSVGVITARSGVHVGPTAGVGATIYTDGGARYSGIITATAFHGDGSSLSGVTPSFIAEGGVETTYESGGTKYMLHTFLNTGVFRTNNAKTIDFLLVGGGGASPAAQLSYGSSGGGGGGGVVEGTNFSLSAGTYVVTVGAGGVRTGEYTRGGNGGDTTFAGVTAKGGGGGGDYAATGADGGSGGGGGEVTQAGGATIQSSQNSGISNIQQFGFAGGTGGQYTSSPGGSGGGGGAGGAGAAPNSTDHSNSVGGAAGAGRANSITGTSTTYGRGGIGGGQGQLYAEPGLNGRGDGATGATASHPYEGLGAKGGTGIVIIRYTI